MHEHGCRHIVAGDAQRFEVGESLVDGPGVEAAGAGQLVGADALVDRRIHQVSHDVAQLITPLLGDPCGIDNDRLGLVQGAD
ncbi:hypothetical protein D3C71_2120790 [compost metagenome]